MEQITVTIVQIVIQATDLAQILYGGHFSRKKRGPRKISIWPPFSKMADMGYCEMCFFASKMALNGQKDYFDNRVCVLSMQIAQLMLQIQFKCSYYFNMAANFKDGHHRLSCNISFALDGSGRSKR